MLKKRNVILLVLLTILFSLSAEKSIYSVTSSYSDDLLNQLLSGETIEHASPYGEDVPSIAFDGTKGKEKAIKDSNNPDCFIMGLSSFIEYPEGWSNMTHEEKKLEIINTLLSISTIKGITYISHQAGEKPKVLFSDSYTLTALEKGKKAYDVKFEYAPEEYEYEIAAYLKDNIFGGNVYIIDYTIDGDEIFVSFTNKEKLKFMFYTAVEAKELNMCVDVLMTKEGLAVFALATVFREEISIETPFVSVHLPSAFMKRIVSLKDWFVKEINS